MYRAYRSNVGIFRDPSETSFSGGGLFGVKLNPSGASYDFGFDIGGNYAVSRSGGWPNPFTTMRFNENGTDNAYEPYYFKAAGELTSEMSDNYSHIGGEDAVRLQLSPKNSVARLKFNPAGVFEKREGVDGSPINISKGARSERKRRGNSIQPITNAELKGPGSNSEVNLEEYNIKYYDLAEDG